MRRQLLPFAILGSVFSALVCVGHAGSAPEPLDPFAGIYKVNSNRFISIAKFDLGDGQNRLLFTDFKSGVIRILTPVSDESFSAGPGLLVNPPAEMTIRFARNGRTRASSLVLQRDGGAQTKAVRVDLRHEEVSFRNGEVVLSGTLITPHGGGPRPAVVLLHGSGPLNRHSFGPFPDFFLSRGLAVLVYDKRGTGSSTGSAHPPTFDDLAADGRAALQFLKGHEGIDARRIGVCGSSQGGFLAALVAAGNRDVGFMINLYGMYVPVWQQELYRAEKVLRGIGLSEREIAAALRFMELEFDVGRTGEGWERLGAEMQRAKDTKWFRHVPHAFSDLNDLRVYWRTLYSYDPAVALEDVTCPVLALFGELDNSTPVPQTVANMRRALKIAGNADFDHEVFSKGNHGLLEAETGTDDEIPRLKRFVRGLFGRMTVWLRKEVFVPSDAPGETDTRVQSTPR